MRASFSGNTLKLRGNIPESCLGKPVGVRMFALDELIRQSFTNRWLLGGGRISDGIGIADTPEGAQTLAVAHSKPMKEILTDMNKRSDNLIARSVFLKLGGDGKLPAVSEQAASAVRRELAVSGIDVADLVLENGSGLSRKERVTARMMAQMLETAYFSPFAQDFIDTLPISRHRRDFTQPLQTKRRAVALKNRHAQQCPRPCRLLAGRQTDGGGRHHQQQRAVSCCPTWTTSLPKTSSPAATAGWMRN